MLNKNILYWVSTVIIALFLILSSYSYIFSKVTIKGIKALGFPDFFRIQLAILKLVAFFFLILPKVSSILKEWSYIGVALFLITAFVAHIAHKDSITISVLLIFLFCILMISYYTSKKIAL